MSTPTVAYIMRRKGITLAKNTGVGPLSTTALADLLETGGVGALKARLGCTWQQAQQAEAQVRRAEAGGYEVDPAQLPLGTVARAQRQAASTRPPAPVTEDTARVLRAFDRLERAKPRTPDELQSAEAEGRAQETYARNVAAGHAEWAPLLNDHGEARLRELRQHQREVT
jgi:hypothetical protein